MTKEQAIKLLGEGTSKEEINRLEQEGLDKETILDLIQEALDMGIEAIETVRELEKRKFTIEDLQEYMKFEDELVNKNFTFRSVIEAREKQIAKRATGFWYLPKCSVCNGMAGEGLRKFNYCPNCGQKIDWSEVNE